MKPFKPKEDEEEKKLKHSEAQLRALTVRIESLREEERTRIAREIHDDMGQVLVGLKIDVRWLLDRLSQPLDQQTQEALQQRLTAMLGTIDDTAEAMLRICTELRPSVLEELGVVAALEWEASEFEARTGVFCNLSLPALDQNISRHSATAIFRIFQEALTNITRHSGATEVDVSLEVINEVIVLTVMDNGRGISIEHIDHKKSLGVIGMRERARACGGSVCIGGKPGSGTTVVLQLPLTQEDE